MTQSKQDIFDKWSPIIESMGVTGSRANWMSQYIQNHEESERSSWYGTIPAQTSQTTPTFENNILPMAMRVAAQTIGLDLVSVVPMGGGNNGEELNKIDAEIKQENRDGKIDAIVEGSDYVEKTREDHPDYRKGEGPKGQLFYMDYSYSPLLGSTTQSSI